MYKKAFFYLKTASIYNINIVLFILQSFGIIHKSSCHFTAETAPAFPNSLEEFSQLQRTPCREKQINA